MSTIVFIINSLRFGGAEMQTVELVNCLARKHDIHLFCLAPESKLSERISKEVKVNVLGKKVFLDPVVLFKLVTKLRKIKPDKLVSVNCYSTMYSYLVKPFIGKGSKTLTIQHTTEFPVNFTENIKVAVYTRIINRMDRIIFVCNNQKKHWVEKYKINPERSLVIYNGVNLEHFMNYPLDKSTSRGKLGIPEGDIVIGVNAVLRPEKKHEHIIDALEMLAMDGYPVKLLIIGDGVRRKHLEDYIRAKNLTDSVIISGFVDDVRPYLASLDISALTSVAVETFSIAALESMAMGKPLVLSNIGGASELVENGENGFLYEAGNIEQLYKSLKYLIDKKLFSDMGKESQRRVSQHFTREIMAYRYDLVLCG